MKITLSDSTPAAVSTESLVAIVTTSIAEELVKMLAVTFSRER